MLRRRAVVALLLFAAAAAQAAPRPAIGRGDPDAVVTPPVPPTTPVQPTTPDAARPRTPDTATPASAAPLLFPTEPATVEMVDMASGNVLILTFRPEPRQLRLEGSALQGMYALLDWPRGRAVVVSPGNRRYVEMPDARALGVRLLNDGMHFERIEPRNVAGRDCTLWRATESDGWSSEVCLTEGGLLLSVTSMENGQVTTYEARRVTPMQAAPSVLFQVPTDFARGELPGGASAGGGGPAPDPATSVKPQPLESAPMGGKPFGAAPSSGAELPTGGAPRGVGTRPASGRGKPDALPPPAAAFSGGKPF